MQQMSIKSDTKPENSLLAPYTKSAASFAAVGGLLLLSAVIVSAYVLVVHNLTVRGTSQDAAQKAAIHVAERLLTVSVSNNRFGQVGICDIPDEQRLIGQAKRPRITGLNTLKASLKTADLAATNLGLRHFRAQIIADLAEIDTLQRELSRAFSEAVRPKLSQASPVSGENEESIYQSAFRIAAESRKVDEHLIGLKIRLGRVTNAQLSSMAPGPAGYVATPSNFSAEGTYKANLPIAIAGGKTVEFYPIGSKCAVAKPSDFQISDSQFPTAVFIEATYKSRQKDIDLEFIMTRTACATIGAPPVTPPTSVFLISFPHGAPAGLHKVHDLLSGKAWIKNGEWLQTAGGNIPGEGHLAPPLGLRVGEMKASEAIELSLYHWILASGPRVSPERLSKLVNIDWSEQQLAQENARLQKRESTHAPNSALTKDTGARLHALLYQSGAGGAGQEMLKNAFDANTSERGFPQSALPLVVDAQGNCSISGNANFDEQLVKDFMESVHNTNVAGLESASIAHRVVERLELANKQLDQNLSLLTEELQSINFKLGRTGTIDQKQSKALRLRQSDLSLSRAELLEKQKQYQSTIQRAYRVERNGKAAADATYALAADLRSYAKDGITRVSNDVYQIGKDYAFTSLPRPVTEEDIYKKEPDPKTQALEQGWLAVQFDVFSQKPTGGPPFRAEPVLPAQPLFVVLDSKQLTGRDDAEPRLQLLPSSPFYDTGLPEGELFFYALDSFTTGTRPRVAWSVLLRDMVAFRRDDGEQFLMSKQARWCLDEDPNTAGCPGLACEVQIRAPVPLLPELPLGTFVVNPVTQERVSQIPPTPSAMI
jgi:hypothetical protein